ncbi:DUF5683 domain-containing protein [Marinoscillum sp.]|uniref:DUF5683 domain-containing protein n=1 Tax=Marinoscillum sp. TaxID=2024838 RepID=UPI003BAA6E13
MKVLITLPLILLVLALQAQPKWINDEPQSESQLFDYFVGEGTSRDEAFLDALEALAIQRGAVTAGFSVEQKREIIDEQVSSEFKRSGKVKVAEKTLVIFPVKKWNNGSYFYTLIGSPKQGERTDGGVMAKGNFIWRSSLVPGWGQFYNKEPSKGLLFSLGTVGLIGGTIFSFSEAGKQGDQAAMALRQGNLAQYNTYDQNEKTWKATGTILGVGAAAVWIINIVDATASDKNLYVFERRKMHLDWAVARNSVGLKITF